MPFVSTHLGKFLSNLSLFFVGSAPQAPLFQPRGVAAGAMVGVAVGCGVTVGSTAGM